MNKNTCHKDILQCNNLQNSDPVTRLKYAFIVLSTYDQNCPFFYSIWYSRSLRHPLSRVWRSNL